MDSVLFISILLIAAVTVTCQKFYDVQLQNVKGDILLDEFIKWEFEVVNYNSTLNVMNGNIEVVNEVPPEVTVNIAGYEKQGNQYYPSLVNTTMNICEFLEEHHVQSIFLSKSDFPKSCPVVQGKYTVQNMIMDSDDLPQRIAGRNWMMKLTFSRETVVHTVIEIYARIDNLRRPKSPKRNFRWSKST